MTALSTAVDAEELAGLERKWGPIARTARRLEVDHPFLSGQHQMLVSDGRRAEICYIMHQGDPQAGVLLHIKTIYPSGAFRLPTGGIQQGETVADTLAREIWEETGLTVINGDYAQTRLDEPGHVQVERLLGIVEYKLAHHSLQETYAFATYHFLVRMAARAELRPQDESEMIGGWQWRPAAELGRVADYLEQVGTNAPRWADWGRYRSLSHRFVMEQLAS